MVVALALKLGRPVRWHEGRAEGMLSMSHGRDQRQYLELGARRDGTIVGMRWTVTQDAGAYPLDGAIMAELTARMASGAYRIPALEFRWRGGHQHHPGRQLPGRRAPRKRRRRSTG